MYPHFILLDIREETDEGARCPEMLNCKCLEVALVHMFCGVFQLCLEGSLHLAPRNLAQAVGKHLQIQPLMSFPFPIFICFEFELCFLIIYHIKK